MKKYKILFVFIIVIFFKNNLAIGQVFFTGEHNKYDDFINTQIWLKSSAGYSFISINDDKTAKGFNWNIGSLIDYYILPKVALRVGLEYENKSGTTSSSDSVFNVNNSKWVQHTYNYSVSYSCFKVPVGIVFNLTRRRRGFIIGTTIIPVLGVSGDIKITDNNISVVNQKAYTYDSTTNYKNTFNRLGLMFSLYISYQFNKQITAGIESTFSMSNIYNTSIQVNSNSYYNPNTNIYNIAPHQLSAFLLINLKQF